VATVVLTFLALLLLLLGGLLDGLFLGSTGAIRAQRADVFVYSANARDSFLRSRITPEVRADVTAAPGVGSVSGLGVLLLGAEIPGETDIANVAVIGYETAPNNVPAVPAAGSAWADDRLRDSGASVGDTVLVGPALTPITIVGFVTDTSFLLQAGLWVDLPTWRATQNANRPDAFVGNDVVQVLIASRNGSSSPAELVASIDAATAGATKSLTKDDAVYSLPGVSEQESTFNSIIYSTLVVVLAVIGLFFSLLTLERTALYGVLKAIGASNRKLFGGVVIQAVVVSVIAFIIGAVLAVAAGTLLPAEVPLRITSGRLLFTFVALVVAAVLGSAISLRRVTRIDPASAIGSTS
jgi:putative ABC transport system permease protein